MIAASAFAGWSQLELLGYIDLLVADRDALAARVAELARGSDPYAYHRVRVRWSDTCAELRAARRALAVLLELAPAVDPAMPRP